METTKFILKRFYGISLFLCLWTMLISLIPGIARADEVKYFDYGNCRFALYLYDDNCLFGDEIKKNDIKDYINYWEVHYKNKKMIFANYLSNNGGLEGETDAEGNSSDWMIVLDKHISKGKLEFDSKERIVTDIVIEMPYFYEICKISYINQTKTNICFDKKGNFQRKTVEIFNNNLLIESKWFDESDNLKGYMTYDLLNLTEKRFTSDGELEGEKEMSLLKIFLQDDYFKEKLPENSPLRHLKVF